MLPSACCATCKQEIIFIRKGSEFAVPVCLKLTTKTLYLLRHDTSYISVWFAARSPLRVPFSLYSHSFKLGTLHCSLIDDIYQNDHKYVTVFTSEVLSF